MANTTTTQARTKVVKTLDVSKTTKDSLLKEVGGRLGNPINGKQVGDGFKITLTGKIEIRDYEGTKGAYLTSKEGFSVKVNAGYDQSLFTEGKVLDVICAEAEVKDNSEGAAPDAKRMVKYCTYATV